MYVCMSVSNGFTIEIYGFMPYLWHVPLMMPSRYGMEIEAEDSEDRRPADARTSPDVWKTVNCSTKR